MTKEKQFVIDKGIPVRITTEFSAKTTDNIRLESLRDERGKNVNQASHIQLNNLSKMMMNEGIPRLTTFERNQ